jgi:hypothetical protein
MTVKIKGDYFLSSFSQYIIIMATCSILLRSEFLDIILLNFILYGVDHPRPRTLIFTVTG